MRFGSLFVLVVLALPLASASKPHSVSFGRAMPVKLTVGAAEDRTFDVAIRALYIDGKVREFTTGPAHEVTDREFVVRRAYRINDTLPDELQKPKWLWQRGGWLLVNRSSGKVSPVKLPEFDNFYSQVSWYRDYAAYCGISSSGERVIAVVNQIGSKKPLFRRDLGANSLGDAYDSNCAAPRWERQPARVTFLPKAGEKFTVTIARGYADVAGRDEDEE